MGSRSQNNRASIFFTRRDVATNDIDISISGLTEQNVDYAAALAGQTDWSAGKITTVGAAITANTNLIAALPGNTG